MQSLIFCEKPAFLPQFCHKNPGKLQKIGRFLRVVRRRFFAEWPQNQPFSSAWAKENQTRFWVLAGTVLARGFLSGHVKICPRTNAFVVRRRAAEGIFAAAMKLFSRGGEGVAGLQFPVAFDEDVTSAAELPVRCHKHGARLRRNFPAAGDPDVAPAVVTPMSAAPNVAVGGAVGFYLHLKRRRRGVNDDGDGGGGGHAAFDHDDPSRWARGLANDDYGRSSRWGNDYGRRGRWH